MGADENAEQSDVDFGTPLSETLEQKLDFGWRIVSLPDGQLLLVPPPAYGDAA
jgi:hypothetical protein